MNPYRFPVTCDVCGGEGVGMARTAAAAWHASSVISHRDPRVCQDNLRLLREKAERDAAELAALRAERDRWTAPV